MSVARINTDPEWACIVCGRGGARLRRGLRCSACKLRAWRAGQYTQLGGALDRIFWTRTQVEDKEDPCAVWTGTLSTTGGYGVYVRRGKPRMAHRHAWELAYGPIPDGLKVCHRCDNPPCIQPSHLFLGTTNDNNQDRHAKGRYAHGEDHAESRLTIVQVREMRDRYPGETRAHLAREYGVGWSTVDGIVKRKAWAWLDA